MKDLASLQRAFQRHVRQPGVAMQRRIVATPRANAERRLAVYADGYRLRLIGALRTDFPALCGVLGEAGFERMARDFVAAHPSSDPNLRWYGGKLAGFLSRAPRWQRRPRLAELARFEWALGIAFDAADAPIVTADAVARVPPAAWPGMRLHLHPSVQLLHLRSNAPAAWKAIDAGREPPAAAMRTRPAGWLIWRKGDEPFYRALPPAEAWALGAVNRGREFAAVVDGLRRFVCAGNAAQTGAQLLRNWLVEELVCGLEPGR